ncbi:MarR family transcriptional regulator [Aquibium sp. A9E412]|uniref:MarR family winged helix-turn-helix transcriptional regulator n=1 Tax=Aquibium sp. A9E412 TaxID=2976767 RepID=UPI0025AEE2A9|nr:MarR family transcriptional regulator [Aquibium sp. A9E412]MDN2567292.1 MarR family transcriptional regulator [Aquibium sp. A9E412]
MSPTQERTESEDEPERGDAGRRTVLLDNILPYLINRLAFRMSRRLNRDLRAYGLGISDWRVLAVLDSARAVTINDLADYAMIEQSTLSRLVMRMEQQALVRRERGGPDGRVVTVSMTDEGRRAYEKVRAMSLAHAERVVMGFSDSEKADLKKAVRRMTRNLEAYDVADDGSQGGPARIVPRRR